MSWTGDGTGPAATPSPMRPALPVMDDPARSPDPHVCPFLRRDVNGQLFAPSSVPGAEQACVAIGGPRVQSLRQQELVCLRPAHADCPRYLRGAMAATASGGSRVMPTVPRATLAALLILVLSAGISFGFVVQRGGLAMPVVGAEESQVAVVATATPAPASEAPTDSPATQAPATPDGESTPSPEATPVATEAPTEAPTPTAAPTVAPTEAPTVAPTEAPTPEATPKATKKPDSARYKLLEPCPDRKNCWIYTVRSGDNLYSIANYFGHSLSTIYEWNPQYPDKRLRVGAEIRMPPPTR